MCNQSYKHKIFERLSKNIYKTFVHIVIRNWKEFLYRKYISLQISYYLEGIEGIMIHSKLHLNLIMDICYMFFICFLSK